MASVPPVKPGFNKPPIGGGASPVAKQIMGAGTKPIAAGPAPAVSATAGETGANPNIGGAKSVAVRAPLFKIESVQQKDRYLKFMVYGNYGSGKTLLAATSAMVEQMKDVIIISAESGDMTLKNDEFDDIDTIKCTNFKQVSAIVDFLRNHCTAREAGDIAKLQQLELMYRGETSDNPKQYKTVIVDSVTEVESYSLYHLLGITERTSIIEDVASAEFKEYKQNNIAMKRLLRSFRDLPMHVMFICSEQYVQDENKRKTYSPALTGKLSSQIQGFMDLVGWITVLEKQKDGTQPRRLHIQPDPRGRYDAKNRFPGYKETYIDIPDIDAGPPGMEVILRAVGLWGSITKAKA